MNNEQPPSNPAPNNSAIPSPAAKPVTAAPAAQTMDSMTTWPGAFGIYKLSKQSVMLNIGTILLLAVGNGVIQGMSNTKFNNAGISITQESSF